MTAKRFTFEIKTIGNKAYTQWYDNGKPINSAENVVDLLNELHEENEQCKMMIATLRNIILENGIDEYALRETLQQDLQRVEEENKNLKTRFKEERELAMRLSRECDTLTIKKQELELEIIRLETIIRTGDVE